jgi:hypothetical protein
MFTHVLATGSISVARRRRTCPVAAVTIAVAACWKYFRASPAIVSGALSGKLPDVE